MWIVCITSVRHVLTVNGYGGRQTKENEKSWCFKGWETLVIIICMVIVPIIFRQHYLIWIMVARIKMIKVMQEVQMKQLVRIGSDV